ncbi:uncharacterized protein SOCEGT47_055290 [Sorangium cellulosum]|uniref:Uncharacterized protein n=1 Tax=Sorangium cellulosum TaxID=56 RepID=A0A4P2Q7B0_SORCE|nr:uncharacterized protein SOCEGT47_055290 [Sorangium cellulosum]
MATKLTPKTRAAARGTSRIAPKVKTTAKAKAQPAAPAQDTQDEEEAIYSLDELVERRGEATVEEVRAYVGGVEKADLVREGRAVATSRIDRDAARLYGKADAFLRKATEAQRDALLGLSDDLLRVAIWAARHGSRLAAARDGSKAKAGSAKAAREAAADAARRKGRGVREQLTTALRILSGGEPRLLKKIDGAYGVAPDAGKLATSLAALVKVGRALLADTSAAAEQRRKGTRLDAAKLDEIEALAGEIRKAGDAAAAVTASASVDQTEVDTWDGMNLLLLEMIIDLFDAGHLVDPSVPRLVPISLGRYFSPRRTKPEKPTEEAPATSPQPQPGVPA